MLYGNTGDYEISVGLGVTRPGYKFCIFTQLQSIEVKLIHKSINRLVCSTRMY